MREARSIVDPNRHASGDQRLDATRASTRRRPVGDHSNINAALFAADKRPNDAGTDGQAVGRDEDLSLRDIDGADGECRGPHRRSSWSAKTAVGAGTVAMVGPLGLLALGTLLPELVATALADLL
jgi:hypothetical protein